MTLPADWLVRFARPLTLLESHDLPAGEAVEAPALGLAPDALAAHRSELAGRLRPLGVAAPFRAGEVVVGLGDSITADALSWFEQIAAGGGGARFVNAGLSGDTTADLRKRAFRIAALRPDWILAMAGTNDCQRHGPREERLVSEAETLRNLLALDAALRRTGARVVWVTPPPVDEAGLGAELARRGLRFRAADLRSVADAMRAVSEEVIDIQPRFTGWEDGVHPTADGQRLIAERVVRYLISANVNGGR